MGGAAAVVQVLVPTLLVRAAGPGRHGRALGAAAAAQNGPRLATLGGSGLLAGAVSSGSAIPSAVERVRT